MATPNPGAVQSANLIAAQTVSQSVHEAPPAALLADPGLHSHQRWVCVLVPLGDRLRGPHQVSLKKGSTIEPKLPLASSRLRLAGLSAHSCPAALAGVHDVSSLAGGAVEVTRPGPFTWAAGDLMLLPAAALP